MSHTHSGDAAPFALEMSEQPATPAPAAAVRVGSGALLASFPMGCVNNLTADKFPKQGSYLGRIVEVCFHYDTSATVRGKIIRDDAEEPGELIIQLDNGRVVRATECQYSFPRDARAFTPRREIEPECVTSEFARELERENKAALAALRTCTKRKVEGYDDRGMHCWRWEYSFDEAKVNAALSLANVKDEPRRSMARRVRKHAA